MPNLLTNGRDVPEEQHAAMRAAQGRHFVVAACAELYACALRCQAERVPWPDDLDQAHALLWAHLGRDPEQRRHILGLEAAP